MKMNDEIYMKVSLTMPLNKELYSKIGDKLSQLGWNSDAGPLQVDLYDLAETCEDYKKQLQSLLTVNIDDKDEVLNILVKIQLDIEHLRYHQKSGLGMLHKLMNMIYDTDEE